MRIYDSSKPLIFIHVPKCGGTSVKEIVRNWYGRGFKKHYLNVKTGKLPRRHRLRKIVGSEWKKNVCIYGHFNSTRGFGIEQYYPEVDQFVTILRDPFELMVSDYFYLKSQAKILRYKDWLPDGDLEHHLMTRVPNMLCHFPVPITFQNYQEVIESKFVYIGITEDLENSIQGVARHLGFNPPSMVKHLNVSSRVEEVPDHLRFQFYERNPLEVEVYEFVKNNYLSWAFERKGG